MRKKQDARTNVHEQMPVNLNELKQMRTLHYRWFYMLMNNGVYLFFLRNLCSPMRSVCMSLEEVKCQENKLVRIHQYAQKTAI